VAEASGQTSPEVIGEIRIHGNAFLTDKEVLDLAGVAVGQPLAANGVDGIARRLKDSDRFETVEVRKRYRSLTSTTDIALVLVVHEKPGVRSAIGGVAVPGMPGAISRRAGRLRSTLMFLPIVSFADGYGFTYGGRMSTVDLLGIDERLSVPLTWGGTRRAALEFERLFTTGPLTRIDSSVAIWNRENPRFEIRDQRVEVKGRAERVFGDVLRLGVDASRSTISFGELDDRLWTLGTSVTLDTRLDPNFPGNAVLLTAGWTGLNFRELPERVNRYTADARGYLRVFRQVVVAGRAQYVGADASLPPYERLLVGGSSSLRGFRTGRFDGDRTLVTSAEVRVPITSVLYGAKLGVTAFVDAARAWDFGQAAKTAEWHRGAGGGLFLIASVVRINFDIARGLKSGDTRVHLSSGFTF
jgi:outer membrane protein assembly factor BamA